MPAAVEREGRLHVDQRVRVSEGAEVVITPADDTRLTLEQRALVTPSRRLVPLIDDATDGPACSV